MEISECCRSGMTWAVVALMGSDGCKGMVALWLELTGVPSGRRTVMSVFGWTLVAGAVVVRKWLEQPLSSMAVLGARAMRLHWLGWEVVAKV